jgi:hypothetical protein
VHDIQLSEGFQDIIHRIIGNSRRWKRWPNISESGRDLRLNAINKNEINKRINSKREFSVCADLSIYVHTDSLLVNVMMKHKTKNKPWSEPPILDYS